MKPPILIGEFRPVQVEDIRQRLLQTRLKTLSLYM